MYQLTLACVVRRLFFPEALYPDRNEAKKLCGDMLSALIRAKKLRSHKFPSGENYYTRADRRAANTQAIDYDLATLWLCMEQKRFHRLTTPELRRLFPTPPHHHVRHCLTQEEGGPVVYRLYFSSVDVKSTVLQAKKHLSESRNKYGLRNWIECGDYGFIVCSESERKSQEVADALQRSAAGSGASHDQARFLVATVPTSATFKMPEGG
ncbi:MAG: hypothetical protein L0228_19450 [Planctomycetes bacterium]|nr:hypothetical protein [Planctomycetota bacterium]